jgi:predicted nuclease of predicted toxin-antitoxin system
MKFLADENFPRKSIDILIQAGFDIVTIGIDNYGIRDEEIIELSNLENRAILTFDRDFGELIFRKGLIPIHGVIYLRWESYTPEEPGEYLIRLFKKEDIQYNRRLTVISESGIRQRSY